jgi:hypothetical protein
LEKGDQGCRDPITGRKTAEEEEEEKEREKEKIKWACIMPGSYF